MAITFVNKGTFGTGTSAITPGLPASMKPGDFCLMFIESANQPISITTNGSITWTEAINSPVYTGSAAVAGGVRLAVYYGWYLSGSTAPTITDSGNHTNGIIMAFRGVDYASPFDATPTYVVDSVATTAISTPAITTVTDNALIVNGIGLDQNYAASDSYTGGANSSLTSFAVQHYQTVSSGVGGGVAVFTGYKASYGTALSSTATKTGTGASSTTAYLTMALRPSSVSTYTITNMLTNSDFASNVTGWSNWSATPSWSSGRCTATASAQYGIVYETITTVTSNKYYIAATIEGNGTNIYLGIASMGGSMVYPSSTSPTRIGNIFTATGTSHSFNVGDDRASAWTAFYFDNAVMVDLTAAFGAGNEPSVAWCDKHIAWFSGTKTLYYTLLTPPEVGIGTAINNAVTVDAGGVSVPCVMGAGIGSALPTRVTSVVNLATVPGFGIGTALNSKVIRTFLQNAGGATLTPTGTESDIVTYARGVGSGTITPSGGLAKTTSKTVGTATVTPTGNLNKGSYKATGGATITPTGSTTEQAVLSQATGGATITPVGGLAKTIGKMVGKATLTPVGGIAKSIGKAVGQAVITPVGEIIKGVSKTVGQATITAVGVLGTLFINGGEEPPEDTTIKRLQNFLKSMKNQD